MVFLLKCAKSNYSVHLQSALMLLFAPLVGRRSCILIRFSGVEHNDGNIWEAHKDHTASQRVLNIYSTF